jgi:hypothetical protein
MMTDTELRLIAAPAMIGLSSTLKKAATCWPSLGQLLDVS